MNWDENDYTSKYFIYGGVVPLRVLFAKKDGLYAGTLAANRESGKLELSAHFADRRLRNEHEVEELSEEEFIRTCEVFFAKKPIGQSGS